MKTVRKATIAGIEARDFTSNSGEIVHGAIVYLEFPVSEGFGYASAWCPISDINKYNVGDTVCFIPWAKKPQYVYRLVKMEG